METITNRNREQNGFPNNLQKQNSNTEGHPRANAFTDCDIEKNALPHNLPKQNAHTNRDLQSDAFPDAESHSNWHTVQPFHAIVSVCGNAFTESIEFICALVLSPAVAIIRSDFSRSGGDRTTHALLFDSANCTRPFIRAGAVIHLLHFCGFSRDRGLFGAFRFPRNRESFRV
jgi:hypothetical protein